MDNKQLSELVTLLTQGPIQLENLQEKFGFSSLREVRRLMTALRRVGYIIREGELGVFIHREVLADDLIPHHIKLDDVFGVWSDTHLCSKYCALTAMHEYMDELSDRGIKQVLHAGDINDGWGVYKNQESNLVAFGVQDQLNYLIDNFPRRKGLNHIVISGNHDSSVLKKTGADVVALFSDQRKDVIYVGREYARLIDQFGIKYDLVHPRSSRAYSISYPLQVRQRNTTPAYRAHVTFAGHRHVAWYGYTGGEHLFECGGFQKASPRYIGKGIANDVSAWIITLNRENELLKSVNPELLAYSSHLDVALL